MSNNDEWHGIPREKIDWHPTINYDKCQNCLACVKFCNHGVYTEQDGKSEVVKPNNCIVGCAGCDSVCPNGAISHPPKEYLIDLENEFKGN